MKEVSGLLGLACRSGQITLGADLALREIRAGRAEAALIDGEASDGTKKKILDACAYRGLPAHMLPAGELSRACGKEGRMAAALKKGGLTARILELLNRSQAD
ncbi:MAG: ribosomal L7Ae/L30e/S12e/Gadd45 family protein [Clostridia bacterium]|nr:ribosomal L7Ae/L30e/S12e/Gadd45 family protein [Clostridia bacterium]